LIKENGHLFWLCLDDSELNWRQINMVEGLNPLYAADMRRRDSGKDVPVHKNSYMPARRKILLSIDGVERGLDASQDVRLSVSRPDESPESKFPHHNRRNLPTAGLYLLACKMEFEVGLIHDVEDFFIGKTIWVHCSKAAFGEMGTSAGIKRRIRGHVTLFTALKRQTPGA
jgi:hypothetical protein